MFTWIIPTFQWIYGGGFEIGGTSGFVFFRFVSTQSEIYPHIHSYDHGSIVHRSIDLDQPVIFVSANYRSVSYVRRARASP